MPKPIDNRASTRLALSGRLRGVVAHLLGAPRWLAADVRERLFENKVSREIRERLIHIEDKVDDIRCGELRERLIDVGDKVDDIRSGQLRRRLMRIEQKLDALHPNGPPPASGAEDHSFGRLTYSRFGEDLVVAEIFAKIGVDRPHYLDVGARHPLLCSNTALLHARGSRGVNVEMNPGRIEAFQNLRPEDVTLNCGVGPIAGEIAFHRMDVVPGRGTLDDKAAETYVRARPDSRTSDVIRVPIRTINDIISAEFGGRWPDLVSLSAGGSVQSVLASADFGGAGPRVIVVKAIDGDDAGATEDIKKMLASVGYEIAGQTPRNLIAVRADVLQSASQLARRPLRSRVAKLDLIWAERTRSCLPDGTRQLHKPTMAKIACRASYTVRMSLSRRSVISDLLSYAHYAPNPPAPQALQAMYNQMVWGSRAGDPHSLYEEALTCAKGDRLISVPVDMTNTQFSGAALYHPPFATGYEPEILALLELLMPKDGVLYDIGSNWGYFTFHALLDPAFRGRVVAMEPVARSLADLENLAAALDVSRRVIALQLAAGDAERIMPISDDAASGNQSLVHAQAGGEMVKVVAIDDLDVPPPALVKLDVERSELSALRGMRSTLSQTRAPIIFENWHDPANVDESIEPLNFLSELGYHLYVPEFTAANETGGEIPFQVMGELSLTDLTASTRADHPARINILASATRLI